MITPQFTVTVDDHNLFAHLETLPEILRKNLKPTITELTNQLLAQVKSLEPVRTGLLRSRTRAYVDDTPDYLRGRVRIAGTGRAQRTAAAFGALEYGVHGRFAVRSYRRGESIVAAYERTVNIQARRFLRGPFEAMRERAAEQIEIAIEKSVAEVNAS